MVFRVARRGCSGSTGTVWWLILGLVCKVAMTSGFIFRVIDAEGEGCY